MIRNYDLADKLPKAVLDLLWDDSRVSETPKSFGGNVVTFLLGSVADSCEAAAAAAKEMGIPICVLTTFLEGESREAGLFLSSVAREIKYMNRPLTPPCFVVCAGETTTSIRTVPQGVGGPSQELVLGLAIGIRNMKGIAAASIDTEGTDGTTHFAGGLVDGQTIDRLQEHGINVFDVFRGHYSGNALMALEDNILTGNTGTNLCDLNIIYIS